jgi:hypothetical protein
MATIYVPTGRKKYIIEYIDENGRRRRRTGTTDKHLTKAIADRLEARVVLRRNWFDATKYPLEVLDLMLGIQLPRDTTGPRSGWRRPVPPILSLYEGRLFELGEPEACVYFLIRDDIVVYVGQSTNVHVRVADHRPDKQFDRVLYLPTRREDLERVEREFIGALRPEYHTRVLPSHRRLHLKPVAQPAAEPTDPPRRRGSRPRAEKGGEE